MTHTHSVRRGSLFNQTVRGGLLRLGCTVLLLMGLAVDASADQRLVRVIWDVGKHAVYYKIFVRDEAGVGAFVVPPNADEAQAGGFLVAPIGTNFLEKADRVRVYVVNYNRVSHVWHEGSSTVEQIAAETDLVGPLLRSLALALTGAGGLPSTVFSMTSKADGPVVDIPTCTADLKDVLQGLTDLRTSSQAVGAGVRQILDAAEKTQLNARAGKLTQVPTTPKMWAAFSDDAARTLIRDDSDVLGFDLKTELVALDSAVRAFATPVRAANAALLKLDEAIAVANIRRQCTDEAEALVQQRENVNTWLKELAGPDSAVRQVIAKFEKALDVWGEYTRKLGGNWADGAVELLVKDPIGASGVLRIDGVFTSPVENFTQRIQRSVALGIKTHLPSLVISAGVGGNGFKLRKLEVANTLDNQSGTPVVRNRLRVVDDTSWEPLTPVWLQSVRLLGIVDSGLYGTFGTTPDRNIFKNAIGGLSVVVPKWRTVFTAGVILARGHEEADVDGTRVNFSDAAGYVRENTDLPKLPLPEQRWVKSPYFSVSFVLASF